MLRRWNDGDFDWFNETRHRTASAPKITRVLDRSFYQEEFARQMARRVWTGDEDLVDRHLKKARPLVERVLENARLKDDTRLKNGRSADLHTRFDPSYSRWASAVDMPDENPQDEYPAGFAFELTFSNHDGIAFDAFFVPIDLQPTERDIVQAVEDAGFVVGR